jgi:hypothetical protein
MDFYSLVLGILGVWRVTHLLQAEDGPWAVMVRFRHAVGSGSFGALLDCFACASLWIAVPFALLLGNGWREGTLLWLAFSAGAILLERATGGERYLVQPTHQVDEE